MGSLLTGGGSKAQKPIVYSGLQVSSSVMDAPKPIFWGQRALGTNALWYNDFQKHKAKGKGKGGKGSGSFTYTAAVILGLSEGVIDSIVNVWAQASSTTTTTLAALNLTFYSGTAVQTPESFVVSKYPAQARSYARTAYLFSPKMDLGSTASIPDNRFECVRSNGFSYTKTSNGWINPVTHGITSAIDVLLSDCIVDLLTHTKYGMNFASSEMGNIGPYATYMRAQGLFFSPLLNKQEKVTTIFDRWAQLSNSWIYWSGSQMQFVPLGDTAVTGNGVTYTPDNSVAYDLGPDDFLGDVPVTVSRIDPADAYNRTTLQITDRTIGYVTNPIEYKDQTLVDEFGLRNQSSVQADEVCDPLVGKIVAQLVGKRAAYIRNAYKFDVSYRRILCLPGTKLTLTEPNIGLDHVGVRVRSIDESEDGKLTFTCEEFPGRIGTFTHGNPTVAAPSNSPNQFMDPGDVNTPGIVEPDSSFTGGTPKILIVASGGAQWGGCQILMSFNGPTGDYAHVGDINAPGVQGVLTAPLASHADPDSTNTLSVDLTESQSTPTPVTHADADALRTLSLIYAQPALVSGSYVVPTNGEMAAFGTVTPTGTFDADLTYLRRGRYGSSPSAHSTGDQFTLVDVLGTSDTTFTYDLPPQYIGTTIYLKFLSFNIFDQGLQDPTLVARYSYTPTGLGYGAGAGGVPTTPTGLAANAGVGQNLISWSANPSTDNVTSYKLYIASGSGASFGSATLAWQGLATNYTHTGLATGSAFTYFLIATNAVGDSTHTAGVSATSGTTPSGTFRGVGGTPGRRPTAAGGVGEELFNVLMHSGDTLSNGGTYGPSTWQIGFEVAPTSNWTMTLKQNGSSIGTGTVLAGHTTGTFTFSTTVAFSTGDLWSANCQNPQDPTASSLSFTIYGTRSF